MLNRVFCRYVRKNTAVGAPIDTPNVTDYLNGTNVTLSNDVKNNNDGTVTVPAGIKSFTASVPVIDDTHIEETETAFSTWKSTSGRTDF